jgi:hypothetical protein
MYKFFLLLIILLTIFVQYRAIEHYEDTEDINARVSMNEVNYQDALSATKALNDLIIINKKLKDDKASLLAQVTDSESKIDDIKNKTLIFENTPDYIAQKQKQKQDYDLNYRLYKDEILQCEGGPNIGGDNIYNARQKVTDNQKNYENYKEQVKFPRQNALDCENILKNLGDQINIKQKELDDINYKIRNMF